jgi:hypothetical protein
VKSNYPAESYALDCRDTDMSACAGNKCVVIKCVSVYVTRVVCVDIRCTGNMLLVKTHIRVLKSIQRCWRVKESRVTQRVNDLAACVSGACVHVSRCGAPPHGIFPGPTSQL